MLKKNGNIRVNPLNKLIYWDNNVEKSSAVMHSFQTLDFIVDRGRLNWPV